MKLILFSIILILLAGSVFAQTKSSEQKQETLPAQVDKIFAAYDRKDSPGCALGVFQSGKIVYSRGYGMANLAAGEPITAKTIFDIGSTSKQFTAASILLLAQRGKLSLDDDVRRYIPELPQYQKPITIRQLMHHTSGLRDYVNLLTLAGTTNEGDVTAKQSVDMLVRQKALNYEPGAEFLYSNSGYLLLSQIAERVTRKNLATFADKNIFKPLGMKATRILAAENKVLPNRAIGYAPTASGFRIFMSGWDETGSGGVHTSIEDLLRWDNNFYKPRVGGEKLRTAILARGVLNNGTAVPYAGGLMIETFRGMNAVSHSGAWVGYQAELVRFPEQHLSVATLCNVASADAPSMARAVAALYLGDSAQSPQPGSVAPPSTNAAQPSTNAVPTAVPEAKLQEWVGTYANAVSGTLRIVKFEGGKLTVSLGQSRQPLVPIGENEFTVNIPAPKIRLIFERLPDRGARRIRQIVDGRETGQFVQFVPPSPEALPAYAGTYFSEELNTTWEVSVNGEVLQVKRAASPPIPLIALPNNFFSSGGDLRLRFIPDSQNRITNFEVSLSRARGIKFVRKGD